MSIVQPDESTSAVVPVSQIKNLPAVYREQAVTTYLAQARDRLGDALAATGPEAVASIKAEVATVQEMTKQLGLSKECRDDATEMVRRAEYALGKAIRKGQEDGTIRNERSGGGPRRDYERNGKLVRVGDLGPDQTLISPSGFFSGGQEGHEIYTMADNATEEEFEDALTEAREEGNLSRANVVRKVKGIAEGGYATRRQRADLIEDYARQGFTSHQIAPKIGVSDVRVRDIAREYSIDIPADRAIGKRRRLDANRILSGAAESVAAAAYSLQQIEPLDLDQDAAREWVDSLTESLTAIRKALNPIKESLRV